MELTTLPSAKIVAAGVINLTWTVTRSACVVDMDPVHWATIYRVSEIISSFSKHLYNEHVALD